MNDLTHYPEIGVATSVSCEIGVLCDVESQLEVSTNSRSSNPTFRLPLFHRSSVAFRLCFLPEIDLSVDSEISIPIDVDCYHKLQTEYLTKYLLFQ